jgi:DnaJ-class molecular chaperone
MENESRGKPAEEACPLCEGTGKVRRMKPPGLIDNPASPLGPTDERRCPRCAGTGKLT